MTLPANFKEFAAPTLIVATDNVQARIFRADGREVGPVGTITKKLEPMEQERSAVMTAAGPRSADEHDPGTLKAWTRERLYADLSDDLMARLDAREFAEIAFAAPEENVNELKECLHVDLLKRAVAFVPKNLVNCDLLDLVIHVREES
jgi:protein required for attachment to host cells